MLRAGDWPTLVALLAASCAHGADARADVVWSPDECPRGSVPHTDHCGPWCEATTCETDADCGALPDDFGSEKVARICREVALCVETEQYTYCRDWGGKQEVQRRKVARSECSSAECARPAVCERAKRCVEPDRPDAADPSSTSSPPLGGRLPGCGCRTAPRGAGGSYDARAPVGSWWALGAAALSLASLGRRRRRRRPPRAAATR